MQSSQVSPPRTEKQAQFLSKLMLSSAFTAHEREAMAHWLESPKATIAATSRAIDRAKARIDAQDNRYQSPQELIRAINALFPE